MILALFGEQNAKRFAYYFAVCGAILLFIAVIERIVAMVISVAGVIGQTPEFASALVNYAIAFGIFTFVIFAFVSGFYLIGRTDRRAQRQFEKEREEHRSEMAAIKAQLDSIQQMIGTHSDESEAEDGKVHTDD